MGLSALTISRFRFEHAYGVGQQFQRPNGIDGDWTMFGRFGSLDPHGASWQSNPTIPQNQAGKGGVLQFPFLMALPKVGSRRAPFLGVLFDHVYKQVWDFNTGSRWSVFTPNTPVGVPYRFYAITGRKPLHVRSRLMDLIGTAPVPPRKMFGMWLSQYGFQSWNEVRSAIASVRDHHLPLDGVVLDLYWFGGVVPRRENSSMGSLSWDTSRFPKPKMEIQRLKREDAIEVIAIEESYVSRGTETFKKLHENKWLVRNCSSSEDNEKSVNLSGWWGEGSMIDWTHLEARKFVHAQRRRTQLINKGVVGHWCDLGEPEQYFAGSCYNATELEGSSQRDAHNVYSLLWVESLYQGYVDDAAMNAELFSRTRKKKDIFSSLSSEENRNDPFVRIDATGDPNVKDQKRPIIIRPFVLSRGGTLGIQRFGTAMWSGDIGSRLDTLAMHMQSQMNMVTVGVDYYSTDTGGFLRHVNYADTAVSSPEIKPSEDEMYTRWLCQTAWTDVPFRIHVMNDKVDCSSSEKGTTNDDDDTPAEDGKNGAVISSVAANVIFPKENVGGKEKKKTKTTGKGKGKKKFCPHRISPALIGWENANRRAIMQRYELIPYYYSLAHHAYSEGRPVLTPLWYRYPHDRVSRTLGSMKMLGDFLLIGHTGNYSQNLAKVYLPPGKWISYHHSHHAVYHGPLWLQNYSYYVGGIFTTPAFVRLGSIIPIQLVDAQTRDAYSQPPQGGKQDGSEQVTFSVEQQQPCLSLRIYGGGYTFSRFTLVEDDGVSMEGYDWRNRPVYRTRSTSVRQFFRHSMDPAMPGILGEIVIKPSRIARRRDSSPHPQTPQDTTDNTYGDDQSSRKIYIEIVLPIDLGISTQEAFRENEMLRDVKLLSGELALNNVEHKIQQHGANATATWWWNMTRQVLIFETVALPHRINKVFRVYISL